MKMMSDLSEDLVGEILCRVPMTSLSLLRSTCKKWNDLSKVRIFGKRAVAARKQFLGFMMINFRVCSLRFDLQGIRNDGDFVAPSINQISMLEATHVFQCDGLLLFNNKDNSRLVVWNPYLGQTRWIRRRNHFYRFDRYAIGYDSNVENRCSHKILGFLDDYHDVGNHVFVYEIYDFSSDSWRVVDVNPGYDIQLHLSEVSLKGNTYFLAQEITKDGGIEVFLLCFDFTRERFGPRLPLPFHSYDEETVTLSCVGEEQLAVLYQHVDFIETIETMEIWVTTKIDPDALSWSKFLKVDMRALAGLRFFEVDVGSFFIDQEKKVVVVFDSVRCTETETGGYQIAYIVGEDGYFKSVSHGHGEALDLRKPDFSRLLNGYSYCYPFVCSSYVPSLVQLQINQPGLKET